MSTCGVDRSALLVTVGHAQYHAALLGRATRDRGIPASAPGICIAADAATVVVWQLPVVRALADRRRTTALKVAWVGWELSWLLALVGLSAELERIYP